jgi:hypothetical protein
VTLFVLLAGLRLRAHLATSSTAAAACAKHGVSRSWRARRSQPRSRHVELRVRRADRRRRFPRSLGAIAGYLRLRRPAAVRHGIPRETIEALAPYLILIALLTLAQGGASRS